MEEKDKNALERELRVYVPAAYRGDSLKISLEDSLGFAWDILWSAPDPQDSIMRVTPRHTPGKDDWIRVEAVKDGQVREIFRDPLGDTGIIGSPSARAGDSVLMNATPDTLLDSACDLSWSGGDSANLTTFWRLRVGSMPGDTLPVFRTVLRGFHYRLDGLAWGKTYRWQVERVEGEDLIRGPIRSFKVRQESPRWLDYGPKPLRFPVGMQKIAPYQGYRGGAAEFTVTPALPEGIKLDSNEGYFSGLAHAVTLPTEYLVRARNAYGECSTTVVLSVDSIPAAEPGLVAYWDFEDAKGDTLRDRSGNGHDGLIRDGEWTSGVRGGGLWFNGASSRVTVPFDSALNLPTYTLEAWIRTVKTNGDQTIIDRVLPDGTHWNYRMMIPGRDWKLDGHTVPKGVVQADTRDNFASSFEDIVFGKTYIPDGHWHHLVVTNRSRLITIYVDGKMDTARIAGPAPVTTTRRELLLGDCDYGKIDFKFQGAMDEVRIYNYDLDSTEVRRRFESFPSVPVVEL